MARIERLDITCEGVFPLEKEVKEKMNELIDAYNKHYHEVYIPYSGTYNSTFAKVEDDDDRTTN